MMSASQGGSNLNQTLGKFKSSFSLDPSLEPGAMLFFLILPSHPYSASSCCFFLHDAYKICPFLLHPHNQTFWPSLLSYCKLILSGSPSACLSSPFSLTEYKALNYPDAASGRICATHRSEAGRTAQLLKSVRTAQRTFHFSALTCFLLLLHFQGIPPSSAPGALLPLAPSCHQDILPTSEVMHCFPPLSLYCFHAGTLHRSQVLGGGAAPVVL